MRVLQKWKWPDKDGWWDTGSTRITLLAGGADKETGLRERGVIMTVRSGQ